MTAPTNPKATRLAPCFSRFSGSPSQPYRRFVPADAGGDIPMAAKERKRLRREASPLRLDVP